MKRILLIGDGRPFWPRIRELLRKVNAVIGELPPGVAFDAGTAAGTDLVIVGDMAAAGVAARWEGPLLILESGRVSGQVSPADAAARQVIVSSSIGENAFLSVTSRLLGVSERRTFRAVIGVKRARHAHVHMGASREFSLTGLSFSVPADLAAGERIVISFYVPGAQQRVSLEAEVARTFPDPEDGSVCYGARFAALSRAEEDVLRRFVWAER